MRPGGFFPGLDPGLHHLTTTPPPSGFSLPEWITAIATAVLALGALLALRQIGEAKRSRHTEAAARMSSRWETEAYVKARMEIDKYPDSMALRDALVHSMALRTDVRHPLLRELSFFEELGAMEKMGATSLRWIDETMHDLVLARWDLWEASIRELEKNVPQEQGIYKNFRLLVDKLNGRKLTRRQRLNRWIISKLSY